MQTSPHAGEPADPSTLVDVSTLVAAYYEHPDTAEASQRVMFGTSGHRGSSLRRTFNEAHILATTQAICLYRSRQGIRGPLFLGIDTHALSEPAFETAMEVLAANGVDVMIADRSRYTPTPAVSRAILAHNRAAPNGIADGIVITPSHNPPEDGGFKYNPPNGGPAGGDVTAWIEAKANTLLQEGPDVIPRVPLARALSAPTTHRFDFLGAYVEALADVLDMTMIRESGVHVGVDPLGGAGVEYWSRIGERYGLNLTVVSDAVDPTFRFMTLDWDGKIRMDPSSAYAMKRLIAKRGSFDVAIACDTDHDRHGVVTSSAGLLPPNHYLSVAVDYLLRYRQGWPRTARVGKTAVTTQLLDRVAARLRREVYETPVGFKWFAEGLRTGALCAGVEESAGASFLAVDGAPWTTDKDGMVAGLLGAEIMGRTGRDPGALYEQLTKDLGEPAYCRIDQRATAAQKRALSRLTPDRMTRETIAGESVRAVASRALGNGESLGGLKVATRSAWFAVRPSGTEDLYKLYAESFRGPAHLEQLLNEARVVVDEAVGTVGAEAD